ncbi:MAG: DUF2058 domain-containing protein [Proteobacteria bacterium]|nr:MAG: DUF2058 domain-containing protein [Pseudomonadota bacterium]
MSMSLREQLLAAGLGTKKQAKQAEHQERRQARNKAREEERRRAAREAQAAKAARDQELNRRRQEAAERKALYAQIKQLVEQNRVARPTGDDYIPFNFIDRGKVRRIAVDAPLRERISRGELVIVRCEGRYDLVPAEIAERIAERDARAVVRLKEEEQPDENDPYKDYVVPDDLIW